MTGCPECPSEEEHEPEECPAATHYLGGTLGACELYYLQYDEGRSLAIRLSNGDISEEDYYHELAEGVTEMHAAGACGV